MGKNKNKSAPFRKRSHFQFERKGSFKKSKRHNSSYEQNSAAPDNADTVYRLLCPGRKIGSVIGKGGDIIKAMRDDTGAKIKVGEAVPGTDERVIIIFSSSTRKPRTDNTATKDLDDPDNPNNPDDPNKPDNPNNPDDPDNPGNPGNPGNPDNPNELEHKDPAEKELENMQPHCSAQDALLKVHERIAEDDDLYGGTVLEDNTEKDVVTARLLVPSNQVGCLLGKGGHIIQKLRSETGANIRILPAEHLPACAMSTDELVQISGISSVVKKALYDISTLLHQNPRPPMNHPMPAGGQGFYPPGPPMANVVPQGNPMWSHRNSVGHPPPSMPWGGRYGNEPSGFGPGGFNGIPPGINGKTSDEFSMKILCSAERIGGVIGKGGSNVKQVQQETGASIHVEDTSPEADERVILVSSFDAPWNPRSPTIDAILLLQSKTNEISEKGITTRLLVPSSKVGCLLGQGGHIITEMRRRTRADIRIISKDGKPNCASTDEELVQISGNINVARDALSEVASRLRMRSLENVNASAEPAPVRPFQRYGPSESFFERGPPPSGVIRAGGSGGYERVQGGGPGGHEYEPQSYPVQPNATPGYTNINSSMEVKIPNSAVGSVLAAGGSNISTIGQMSGAKVKLNDPSSGTECVVEIHGSSEQMNAAQNLLQTFISNAVHNYHPHQQGPPPQQQVHQQLPHQIPPQQPPQQQIPHHVPQQFTHQQAPQQHSYHQYPQHISHQQVPQEQIPQQVQGLPQQIPYQVPQPQHPQQGEVPQQIPYQVPQPQHPQQGEVLPQRIFQQGPYQY